MADMLTNMRGLVDQESENLNQQIGKNLRRIRRTRHLSLEEVSRMSGVSKSMISEIERGTKSPTINILYKICSGIHISFKSILQPEVRSVEVARGLEQYYKGELKYRMLFDYDMDSNLELTTIYMEPNTRKDYESHGDGVWEYVMVISGEFTLELREGKYCIGPGECVRFRGNQKHTYANETDEGVWVYNMIRYDK